MLTSSSTTEHTDILCLPDYTSIEKIKKYIILDRFSNEINKQICEAVVSEIKYQLSILDIDKKGEDNAKVSLENLLSNISYDEIKAPIEQKYNDILKSKNYANVLSLFNKKDLSKSIGHYFGLQANQYCDFITRQLQGSNSKKVLDALVPYLPSEIPLT